MVLFCGCRSLILIRCILDFTLEVTLLFEKVVNQDVLSFYFLVRIRHHVFYEEFTVTKFADFSLDPLLPTTFVKSILSIIQEESCLLKADFAGGLATEMAMRIFYVSLLLPGSITSVASGCIFILSLGERFIHKENPVFF